MEQNNIGQLTSGCEPIPFAATVANPDCSLEDAIENIDIGGPTMVRAAKNHKDVTIVVNASDYAVVLEEMNQNAGGLSYQTRFDLAIKVLNTLLNMTA